MLLIQSQPAMSLQSSTFTSLLGLLSFQAVKSAASPTSESTAALATPASVPQEPPAIETDVEEAIADSTIGKDSSGPPVRGRYDFGCVLGVSVSDCKSWNYNGPGGYCGMYSSTTLWHNTNAYWYEYCRDNCFCQFQYY